MNEPTQNDDYILLKWGSIKAWNLSKDKDLEILQRYANLGMSMSAAVQKDTTEQKEILCELIRGFDGTIENDWSGEKLTKEEAIRYIMEYGNRGNQ